MARVVLFIVTLCPRYPCLFAPSSSEPHAGAPADWGWGDGLASRDGDPIHDGALAEAVTDGLVPAAVEVAALAAESDEKRASGAPRGADHARASGGAPVGDAEAPGLGGIHIRRDDTVVGIRLGGGRDLPGADLRRPLAKFARGSGLAGGFRARRRLARDRRLHPLDVARAPMPGKERRNNNDFSSDSLVAHGCAAADGPLDAMLTKNRGLPVLGRTRSRANTTSPSRGAKRARARRLARASRPPAPGTRTA